MSVIDDVVAAHKLMSEAGDFGADLDEIHADGSLVRYAMERLLRHAPRHYRRHRSDIVWAAALIVAEIERLDREPI